jgi:hypothetical protein
MTTDELKQILHYSPETGQFTWLISKPRIKIGNRAGTINKTNGYRQIRIDGKDYQEHRLVWLWQNGSMPSHQIDHINRIRDDNRIQNLREATTSENHENLGKNKSNTSGFTGVCAVSNKWKAQITKHGKNYNLGYFQTPEEAHQAYVNAKSQLHTFNPMVRN